MYEILIREDILRKRNLNSVKSRPISPKVFEEALVRAKANKVLGAIDAPTYHMIEDKINSLKKLKFTQEWESWKDSDTYEWMKYKVAAEVGGE